MKERPPQCDTVTRGVRCTGEGAYSMETVFHGTKICCEDCARSLRRDGIRLKKLFKK